MLKVCFLRVRDYQHKVKIVQKVTQSLDLQELRIQAWMRAKEEKAQRKQVKTMENSYLS